MTSAETDVFHRALDQSVQCQEVVADFARREVDVIAINGGDGTIQRFLTALLVAPFWSTPPKIAILRGGTTNLISRDVGVRGSAAAGLRHVLASVRSTEVAPTTVTRNLLRVEGLADSGPQYGMFLSLGALARTIAFYETRLAKYRLMGSLLVAAAAVRMARECLFPPRRGTFVQAQSIGVGVDGGPIQDADRCLVFATTLDHVSRRVLWWNQSEAPMKVTSVAFPPRDASSALWRMVRGLPGDRLPKDTYASGSAERIDLGYSGPVAIDGELFAATGERPMVVQGHTPIRFLQA